MTFQSNVRLIFPRNNETFEFLIAEFSHWPGSSQENRHGVSIDKRVHKHFINKLDSTITKKTQHKEAQISAGILKKQ